jgi:hypothetical protein
MVVPYAQFQAALDRAIREAFALMDPARVVAAKPTYRITTRRP